LSPRQAVMQLYGLGAGFAVLALILANHEQELIVVGIFCAIVWFGVRRLQYAEFDVAGRLLSEGWLQNTVNAHVQLRQFENRLKNATTPDECWSALRESYLNFGFTEITAQFGNQTFREMHDGEQRFWHVDILVAPNSRILLGARCSRTAHSAFPQYVDAIRNLLEAKLTSFSAPPYRPALALQPPQHAMQEIGGITV
jgi:hypothetical protein